MLTAGHSQQQSPEVPDRIDLSSFPGQMIEQVIIPVPAEIFAILDKIGDPDWGKQVIHVETMQKLRERGFIAMAFGSLVAEGFIAVEARDVDDIQKIGMRSLEMAETLGLQSAVKPHSLSVVDASKKGKWDLVRSELDKTQTTVRETMTQQRDQELAGLVSLGGWLRGTHVLTGLIAEDYTYDKAELLNQPGLVGHFRKMVAGLGESLRGTREMIEVEKGLGRVEALLRERGGDEFSLETVQNIHKITREMLNQFYFDDKR